MSRSKVYEEKMKKSIESVKADFASVRAGRANAAVLDRISVDYYGTPHPHPAGGRHRLSRPPDPGHPALGRHPAARPLKRPSRPPTWASIPRTTASASA